MSAHELVNDWQASGTPSTHTCKGCPWKVETYAKPRQATAAAVQRAFDKHLDLDADFAAPCCGFTELDHSPDGTCPLDPGAD